MAFNQDQNYDALESALKNEANELQSNEKVSESNLDVEKRPSEDNISPKKDDVDGMTQPNASTNPIKGKTSFFIFYSEITLSRVIF